MALQAHLVASGLTRFDCPAVGPNGCVVLGPQICSPLLCRLEVLWLPMSADAVQLVTACFAASPHGPGSQAMAALMGRLSGQASLPKRNFTKQFASSARGQGSIAVAKVHVELSCSGQVTAQRLRQLNPALTGGGGGGRLHWKHLISL